MVYEMDYETYERVHSDEVVIAAFELFKKVKTHEQFLIVMGCNTDLFLDVIDFMSPPGVSLLEICRKDFYPPLYKVLIDAGLR